MKLKPRERSLLRYMLDRTAEWRGNYVLGPERDQFEDILVECKELTMKLLGRKKTAARRPRVSRNRATAQ